MQSKVGEQLENLGLDGTLPSGGGGGEPYTVLGPSEASALVTHDGSNQTLFSHARNLNILLHYLNDDIL